MRRFFTWSLVALSGVSCAIAAVVACGDSTTEITPGACVPIDGGTILNGPGQVLTSHNDEGRTGQQLEEEVLTPQNVCGLQQLGQWDVDGEIFAQPLVVEGVQTSQGTKTLVLVETMNNSMYAFDADAIGSPPIWHRDKSTLGDPLSYHPNFKSHGILSTPVVDPQTKTMYAVVRACTAFAQCQFRLHAISLATGETIKSVAVGGHVDLADGPLAFDPLHHWNRPGLLLHDRHIYIGFGFGPLQNEHEENTIYHGWIFGYDIGDLDAPPTSYCATPQQKGGGVWMAGMGIAADESGLYFATGNGGIGLEGHPPSDYPTVPRDHEDSVVRLPISDPTYLPEAGAEGGSGALHFWDDRPYDDGGNIFQYMESNDVELGSVGTVLIPGSRTLVTGGKAGIVYTLDRDTMKLLQPPLHPFTQRPLPDGGTLYIESWAGTPAIMGGLAYYKPNDRDGLLYAWPSGDLLKSFRYDPAKRTLVEEKSAPVPPRSYGALLSISSNHGKPGTAILWAQSSGRTKTAGQLWAFDPITLETLNILDIPARAKFIPPTVARGKIFVPSATLASEQPLRVMVFGLKR